MQTPARLAADFRQDTGYLSCMQLIWFGTVESFHLACPTECVASHTRPSSAVDYSVCLSLSFDASR